MKKIVTVNFGDKYIYLAVGEKAQGSLIIEKTKRISIEDDAGLHSFIAENKLKNSKALISLGGKQIVSRLVSMPEMPEKELKAALNWETVKFFNTAYTKITPEETVFDYELFDIKENGEEKQQRIIVIAARVQYVDVFCSQIQRAGLNPAVVDVQGNLLGYFHQFSPELMSEEGIICSVCIHEGKGSLSFTLKNKSFFFHSFECERDINSKIATELPRVASYLQRQYQLDAIQRIVLIGNNFERDTAEFLKEELALPLTSIKREDTKLQLLTDENEALLFEDYWFNLALLIRGAD